MLPPTHRADVSRGLVHGVIPDEYWAAASPLRPIFWAGRRYRLAVKQVRVAARVEVRTDQIHPHRHRTPGAVLENHRPAPGPRRVADEAVETAGRACLPDD